MMILGGRRSSAGCNEQKGLCQMDPQTIEEARRVAQKVAERLAQDPAYEEELRRDPAGTLRAAGLPEATLQAALIALGASPEVSGYQELVDPHIGIFGGILLLSAACK